MLLTEEMGECARLPGMQWIDCVGSGDASGSSFLIPEGKGHGEGHSPGPENGAGYAFCSMVVHEY